MHIPCTTHVSEIVGRTKFGRLPAETFADASVYQIEQQDNGSTRTTLETIPCQQGSNTRWARAVIVTTIFRVEAAMTDYTVPLDTLSQQ